MKINQLMTSIIFIFMAFSLEAKTVLKIDFKSQQHRLAESVKIEDNNKLATKQIKTSNKLQNVDRNRSFVSYRMKGEDYFIYIEDPRIIRTPPSENQQDGFATLQSGSYLVTIPHDSFESDSLRINLPKVIANGRQTLNSLVMKIAVDL